MSGLLNIGANAAIQAGKIILRGFSQLDKINVFEKSTNDFVSDIDHKSESIIISTIEKAYPNHSIISEEAGVNIRDEITWIIDPLDGTNNFIHGFPHFSVSIAVKIRDFIEHAIVYDPINNHLYTATRGQGAQLNNKRIRISNKNKLIQCLVATECPFHTEDMIEQHLKSSKIMMGKTAGLRRTGSAALNLAYVASGKLDGFWQSGIKIWDMAAGVLLVKEAGGTVYDFQRTSNYLESNQIIAASIKIADEIFHIVNN
ncbi:MAG: inositol monophosphatase [Legionellales bacterium]|nr:inositol monophosphatase [Legionellales bacterium]